MSPLLTRVSSLDSLTNAWHDVLDGADVTPLAPDEEAHGVQRFAQDAEERLEELAETLAAGTYHPADLTQVRIPKDDGDWRVLDVPRVADRVVERSLLNAVAPFVDPILSVAGYGYRPGLGVVDAVQRIAALRDEGLGWVLRGDIDNCFPTLPRDRAVAALMALLPDDSLAGLIEAFSSRRTRTEHSLQEVPGLAQGAALSPLLCNLVLRDLDFALLDRGYPMIRYGDDFTVVGRSEHEMTQALAVADKAVGELGMALEPSKTAIMSFDEGFCFLGEDFGPKYPPTVAEFRVEASAAKVLYVGRQGSHVRIKDGRIVVTSKDEADLLDVPASHVERLVLFGAVGLTAGARAWLLGQGVETVLVSRKGSYAGLLTTARTPARAERLRAQLAATPARQLAFAQQVVRAKLRHQVTLLHRFGTPEQADEVSGRIDLIRRMDSLIDQAQTPDELMGLEGTSARSYFEALSLLLPVGLRFAERSRRPPRDVINAALGYGYAVLLGECVSALVSVGLEPSLGLFHADQDSRPSLALDLMEEFRPYVVDQVVLTLGRGGGLTPADGKADKTGSGVWLTKAGKDALLGAYEKRLLQVTRGALPGFSGSIRRHLVRQAQRLAQYLTDPEAEWSGLSWR